MSYVYFLLSNGKFELAKRAFIHRRINMSLGMVVTATTPHP